jgi:hypothetical protein
MLKTTTKMPQRNNHHANKETMMVSEKEFNDVDLSVNQNNLYLEESFTDLDMASIRRLTPVRPNGLKDKTRKQIFVGHLNLMTPEGPLPIQTPLPAKNLKQSMEIYPEAMKIALAKIQEKIEKFQQKQDSRIIVPGT